MYVRTYIAGYSLLYICMYVVIVQDSMYRECIVVVTIIYWQPYMHLRYRGFHNGHAECIDYISDLLMRWWYKAAIKCFNALPLELFITAYAYEAN